MFDKGGRQYFDLLDVTAWLLKLMIVAYRAVLCQPMA